MKIQIVIDLSLEKNGVQNTLEQTYLKSLKGRTGNPEFSVKKKYPSRIKAK